MRKNISRFINVSFVMVIMSSVLVFGTASYSIGAPPNVSPVRGIQDKEIKIGVTAPLTGPMALDGRDVKTNIEFVVNQINAAGGIHGRTLKLIFEDHGFDPGRNMPAARKLVGQDEVFCLLEEDVAYKEVLPYLQEQKVPSIDVACPSDDMVHDPLRPYAFQIQTCFYGQMVGMVDEIMTRYHPKTIGICIWDFSLGPPWVKNFTERLQSAYPGQAKIVATEYIALAAPDYSSQWLRIKAAKPDLIAFGIPGNDCGRALKQARQLGITAPIVGELLMNSTGLLASGGKAIAGIHFVCDAADSTSFPKKPLFKKYVEEYRKAYPEVGNDVGGVSAMSYGGAQLFAEALRRAGRDITVEKFVKACETLRDFDPIGILPVSWSPTDHRGTRFYNVFRYDEKGNRIFVDGPKPIKKMGPNDK